MGKEAKYHAIRVDVYTRNQYLNEFLFVYPGNADRAEEASLLMQTLKAEMFPEQDYELQLVFFHDRSDVAGGYLIETLKVTVPNDPNPVMQRLCLAGYLSIQARHPELFDVKRLAEEVQNAETKDPYAKALLNAAEVLADVQSRG